jgi:hypothetical protein
VGDTYERLASEKNWLQLFVTPKSKHILIGISDLSSAKWTPGADHSGQFASRMNMTGSPNNEKMLTEIRAGSASTSCQK